METLIEVKDDERFAQWEANGRKGPPPERVSKDRQGPPEFESLPDIMEVPGITAV